MFRALLLAVAVQPVDAAPRDALRFGVEVLYARWRLPAFDGEASGAKLAGPAPRWGGDELREVPGVRLLFERLWPDLRVATSLTLRDEVAVQADDRSVLDEHRVIGLATALVASEAEHWALGAGLALGAYQPFEGETAADFGLGWHVRLGPRVMHLETSAADHGFDSAGPGRYRLGLGTQLPWLAVFGGLAFDEALTLPQGPAGLGLGLRIGPLAGLTGRLGGIWAGSDDTFGVPNYALSAGVAYERGP